MGEDDSYHDQRPNGVREPDPTLGRPQPKAPDPQSWLPQPTPEPEPPPKPPRRQRVVLADPRQPTSSLRARVELEEQTSWGELLIKDLVKAQLRTGLWLSLLTVAALGGLPAAFYFSPTFAGLTVVGVPLPWVLLGVLPFPVLFGIGLWYNRLAERHERDFVDMIEN
ncbi:hypothetical protein [Amycolatopsis nigrescens]|uniref:hypothetical protein n=1 Tax=Amycolatopsis nigrescens TaxID=381445 RepID=UPI00035F2EEE|nr:hypothetical protein [Amycolatopsis nigrescens]